MATSREKFIKLMRDDILKFDLAELDFGLYRILRYERDAMMRFLAEELPARVERTIKQHGQDRLAEVRQRLGETREQINKTAQGFGLAGAFDAAGQLHEVIKQTPRGNEYLKLEEELSYLEAQSGFTPTEEENFYNHLYTFFSRYYRDGDFLPLMRRSRQTTFVVPYRGEDVHFFWRGHGSHYIKTTEELKTYRFRAGSWQVHFELVEANVEQDNVKGKTRYFVPWVNQVQSDEKAQTFSLPFVFIPLSQADVDKYQGNGGTIQEHIIEDALPALKKKLPPTLDSAEIHHHMRRYARKNLTDYFVHPQLGDFLRQELDYYLKSEFLLADALTNPGALSDRLIKYQALKEVGVSFIAILDQIESFQARLFEKRKFVLQTTYLVPVRCLPRDLWPKVVQNAAQIAAWRTLFALEGEVTEATLQTHPTLVVDTRYFDRTFALEALAAFDDLDEATDGLLVHAENYAALQTLEPKYRNKVKVIYIDPPYNTGSDQFLYKDDFSRHSTWLTMMAERLQIARDWLDAEEGVIFISIDDNEYTHLKQLADNIFGPDNFVATIIWQKIFSPKNTAQYFSEDHDYLLVYAKNKADWRPYLLPRSEEADARYSNPDKDSRGLWASSDLTARNYYSEGQYEVTSPMGKKFVPPSGRYWALSKDRFLELDREGRIWWGEDRNNMPRLKRFLSDVKPGIVPQTLWKHGDVGNTQEAKKELLAIVTFARTEDVLNTVKPTRLIHRVLQIGTTPEIPDWVVDFFAGSGTTGHAVMSLNRADGGQRKFVLVEMGEYFDQLVYQRIIRAMYTPDWKEGRPVEEPQWQGFNEETMLPDWVQRSPRLVKVLRLESYDDSLNALETPEDRIRRRAGQMSFFSDELHYNFEDFAADSLVTLNLKALERPFDYRLHLYTPEGEQNLSVDLVETANLLLGLHVKRVRELYDRDRRYVVVEANEGGREALVIWRDTARLDPTRERDFLRQHFDLDKYAAIYTNADSAVSKGSKILDLEFQRSMLKPTREGNHAFAG